MKTIIGLEITVEKKKEIIEATKKFKMNNVNVKLSLAQFIRTAIDELLAKMKGE